MPSTPQVRVSIHLSDNTSKPAISYSWGNHTNQKTCTVLDVTDPGKGGQPVTPNPTDFIFALDKASQAAGWTMVACDMALKSGTTGENPLKAKQASDRLSYTIADSDYPVRGKYAVTFTYANTKSHAVVRFDPEIDNLVGPPMPA